MIKQHAKKILSGYVKWTEYKNKLILSGNEGNQLIKSYLEDANTPVLVSRIGSNELEAIFAYINRKNYSPDLKRRMHVQAGVFPVTNQGLDDFSEIFIEALKKVDILGVWFNKQEGNMAARLIPEAKLIELECLEPYYWNNPWSQLLANKKVLVIHPFAKSIERQFQYRKKLFENHVAEVLPEFELQTMEAVQSAAGNIPVGFTTWSEAFSFMCEDINKREFDVAIIGAGAYGLPLAAHIKYMNKQAIHMGGSSQILFGIQGRRWDNHPIISKFYNEYWTRPGKEETYTRIRDVENGCYW